MGLLAALYSYTIIMQFVGYKFQRQANADL
jgi:hypothetical protein